MSNSIDWHQRARETSLVVRNFINGKWSEASGEQSITKYSPVDGSTLYSFGEGSAHDVDRAVSNARAAYEDGRWANQSLQQRKAVLNKLADLIEEHKETFALYETLDVGKPITYSLHDDISRAVGSLRTSAEKADKLFSLSSNDGGILAYQQRRPVGVVGAIVGWNYPLALAASKVGPALAMGNSLVLKPSEFTSLSACHLAELAMEAGVPAGVFNVVNGNGVNVGAPLASHMDVDLISFVGSTATGKLIMSAAAQSNMKRVLLECGGKSPYIVFDDCPEDLDAIAADVVANAFPNQGALCIAGSRLLVQESIKDKLLPKVIEHAAKITPADPLDPETTFGALVNEAHMNKVLAYVDSGEQEGAERVYGGERVNLESGGYYVRPAVFDQVDPQQKIAQEEIFGPVLSVLTFKDEEEAIRLANNTCYGLAAYAATQNLGRAQRLGKVLNAGFVMITGTTSPSGSFVEMGVEAHKQSGFGFEGGTAGLAEYSVCTAVYQLV